MLKQIRIFFFTAPCLVIKDGPSFLSTVNDIDSSLTNTNDWTLTYLLLFPKASLDISAKTLILNATMNYIISTTRFVENLFSVCLSNSFLFFFTFTWNFLHGISFFNQVSLEYLKYLVIVIFNFLFYLFLCTIFLLYIYIYTQIYIRNTNII